jgi:hypothetical protein
VDISSIGCIPTVITRAGGANWLSLIKDKDLYIKPPHFWVVFFFIYLQKKEHQIFGIRAIIEAIKQELQ